MGNLIVGVLGHPRGQMGVKLPISRKKASENRNFDREMIYFEKFHTVTHLGQINIIALLGPAEAQIWSKKSKIANFAKKTPQKQKICTDRWIYFHEKFDVFSYLLHTTTF